VLGFADRHTPAVAARFVSTRRYAARSIAQNKHAASPKGMPKKEERRSNSGFTHAQRERKQNTKKRSFSESIHIHFWTFVALRERSSGAVWSLSVFFSCSHDTTSQTTTKTTKTTTTHTHTHCHTEKHTKHTQQ
jgi:hypothetical protein